MPGHQFASSPCFAPTISFLPDQDFPELKPLENLLAGLYRDEMSDTPAHTYLREHSAPKTINSHVQLFRWYWPYISEASAVLDWGCQHAPDAVLLRYTHDAVQSSQDLSISGCDFAQDWEYPHFRAAAKMTYQRLDALRSVPYDDDQFDAVIAAGVLEHVASDYDSLRELHRVLRPGGRLVITFLPNQHSLDERRLRRGGLPHHERLYTRRYTRAMLLHSGFRPLTPVLYQTPAWQYRVDRIVSSRSAARSVTSVLRWMLPLQVVRASTLCVIAEKTTSFA